MSVSEQGTLFKDIGTDTDQDDSIQRRNKTTEGLPRLDTNPEVRQRLLPYCRLNPGDVWVDDVSGHRVGVLDATNRSEVEKLMGADRAELAINDPPYNVAVGNANTKALSKVDINEYVEFSKIWVENVVRTLAANAHFYIWIGADYEDNFQPLPDFMIMMREIEELSARNFITMRNQRGYGSQHNWMWVRQELLHYIKGKPPFKVVYTEIPKILRGYYKKVNGKVTENIERSKSENIRPGNVWVDVQQVFYRMEENVPGSYAQKPLKAIERLIETSSKRAGVVVDFFSHSGTTLVAGEKLGRRVFTCDIDPVYAELTIRRLENFRKNGVTGWQWRNPFPELDV